MIPFLDLKTYNNRFNPEIDEAFRDFLDSGHYILGDQVRNFEAGFASYCGTEHCIGTANGLDALNLILRAWMHMGLLATGDEVIVPANTYIASILPVVQLGLKPIFVEPDEQTFNLDPENIESVITKRTKVILAVHLYGQLAAMKELKDIAEKYDLLIMEDAAQAHGAQNEDMIFAGNLSHAAAFSFYPTKNLGALGDAGAVTTNDNELQRLIRQMRDYGRSSKYINDVVGINSRLDEFQAAILNIKLKVLDQENNKRREMADFYLSQIQNSQIQLPFYSGKKDHVFHQFVLRVKERPAFISHMKASQIGTLIHYPVPPHKQKALIEFNHLDLPVTESIHEHVVSIPLNPTLHDDDLKTIVKHINAY
ncbi:MAG: DegT/DnrJ/EryC1/StrS family aminotransferase [Flavobacteriaceae bacterium]|nr:DegT/DnrJ/EryC1/StrS family aminotransferase [Flavobacteriaceae bacterium]NNK72934.1 DegT/DnrJ/EryC1/StrS family aminotransferase [Flavobacteriaceae bacterium]